jgi:actin-like ATPase involved in cell morphogenesis
MSVGIGVDVGATAVKIATADATSARPAHIGVRELDYPDLISRVGTGIPFVGLGGETAVTRHAHDMFADEVRRAITRLTEPGPDGGSSLTVIAPDWWTPRAREAVRVAMIESGMAKARLESAAVAAVKGYQAVAPSVPDTVAVLDLGAYSCSAAVVTGCSSDDIRRVGHPTVVHGRGGNDLDARLLHHVLDGFRSQGLTYRRNDMEAVDAARRLLVECRRAKEALSAKSVTTMATHMPGASSQVRLVRAEHDDIARPAVQEIVHVLRDCIAAGEHDVEAVLLVGGGAPIPIVTQQISVELGLPVLLDDDPATLAARGAALVSGTVTPTQGDPRRKSTRRAGKRVRSQAERTPAGRRRAARADDFGDEPKTLAARGAELVPAATSVAGDPPPESALPPATWVLPRAESTSAPSARRRVARTGFVFAYMAIALIATGGPSPSASSSRDASDVPANASQEVGAPVDLLGDQRAPRPPSDAEPDVEPTEQLVPASAVGVVPTTTPTTAPKPKKTTGTSGSTGGGGGTSNPDPTPPDPEPDPPTDPTTDPPPPPADDGTGGDVQ